MDLPQLRDFITRNFNDSELRDLCFDLGIEYENLGGDNKSAKARELVAYCQRHTRLGELEATCRRLRPNAPADSRAAATEARPTGTVVNQSGGVTINAQTVNITGDVVGRDKKTPDDSEPDQSPASS
jgi:hypothetical protein